MLIPRVVNFLQISTSVKLSKTRVTRTPNAPTLLVHVNVRAKKATQETVLIAEVSLTAAPGKKNPNWSNDRKIQNHVISLWSLLVL